MSGRKSDDDIRKYLPDLDAVLRGADPQAAKERRRQALAEIEEGEDEETSPKIAGAGAAASPWAGAGAGAGEIDKGALPSSHAPGAVPPVTRPIPSTKEGAAERRRPEGFPAWLKSVAAVIGVLGPIVVLLLVQNMPSSKTPERGEEPRAVLTSAGAVGGGAATATATATGSASAGEPSLPPVATGSASAGEPSLPPMLSATPAPSGKRPRVDASADDPYTDSSAKPSGPPPEIF